MSPSDWYREYMRECSKHSRGERWLRFAIANADNGDAIETYNDPDGKYPPPAWMAQIIRDLYTDS